MRWKSTGKFNADAMSRQMDPDSLSDGSWRAYESYVFGWAAHRGGTVQSIHAGSRNASTRKSMSMRTFGETCLRDG